LAARQCEESTQAQPKPGLASLKALCGAAVE
jgi:hypothetical protein